MEIHDQQQNNLIQLSNNYLNQKYPESSRRKKSEILAELFQHIPFQLFIGINPITYTIGINPITCRTVAHVKDVVKEFREQSERYHRAPWSAVIAYDTHPSAHCHLCLASSHSFDRLWMHRFLRVTVGKECYDLKEYDKSKNGLQYTLRVYDRFKVYDAVNKNFDQNEVDLELINLEYYFPETARTCRERQRLRRHVSRGLELV